MHGGAPVPWHTICTYRRSKTWRDVSRLTQRLHHGDRAHGAVTGADFRGRSLKTRQERGYEKGMEENPMITTRVMRLMVGLTLLAMVVTGCGTLTGAAIGAGSGAAIGAGTGHTKKGALIGTGVGAAAGAIYDATRWR
jgi:hypothetical protein